MKIYYFGTDHAGTTYAGVKHNGQRTIEIVKNDIHGNPFVTTYSIPDGKYTEHLFSEAQRNAYAEFLEDGKRTEFREGIA